MPADEVDYVVGVDTHRDQHVLAVVAAPAGAVVAQLSVRASARGYVEAVRFAEQHAGGARVWAVEGAGHYGAGLARHLSGRGETVLEIGRGPRDQRPLRGKDDSLDAIRAARTALASETLTLPRAGQRREALRLLLLARRSAVDVRREALVQLRSVIVTCPDRLREQLRGLPAGRLIVRCSRLRRPSLCTADELASRLVLRSLSRRVEAATAEASELEREIHAHVRALAATARRARRWRDRRRAADRRVVTPRPGALSSLRSARRRCPGPRLIREDDPASTQPRRRQATQLCAAHRHPSSPPARPRDEGLHRTPNRRRQNNA